VSPRFALSLVLAGAMGCASAKPTTTPSSPKSSVSLPPPPAPTCSTAKAKAEGASQNGFIVRVEMLGNKRTPLKIICAVLRTKAGEELDEANIARDIRELFDSGLMDDVRVSSEVSPAGRSITFRVRERPVVNEWIVKASGEGPPSEHLRALLGNPGDLFNPQALRAGVARVREEYVELGFRAVDIATLVTPVAEGQVDIEVAIDKGQKQIIKAIRFSGTAKVKEGELLALIETEQGKSNTPGGVYREETMERALLMMTSYYYDRGMIQVKVSEAELTLSQDKASLTVSIAIDEGPVFRVGKLRCSGDLAGTEKECLTLLGVKKGDVFSRAELSKGIARIRGFQTPKGHGTQIDPATTVDPKTKTVDLELTIEK
jgi:outer membrane protein insertion porin family